MSSTLSEEYGKLGAGSSLEELTAPTGAWRQQLTSSQDRMAAAILNVVKSAAPDGGSECPVRTAPPLEPRVATWRDVWRMFVAWVQGEVLPVAAAAEGPSAPPESQPSSAAGSDAASLCSAIDAAIEVFDGEQRRALRQGSEQREAPPVEASAGLLLDAVQSLLGYRLTRDHSSDKYAPGLDQRIELVEESLENYGLSLESYDGTNDSKFERVGGEGSLRMTVPAVVRGDEVVRKGRLARG